LCTQLFLFSAVGGYFVTSLLCPEIRTELEQQVKERTGRRVRNLTIEVLPEQVILRGQANSYYIKQLAQHSVHGMLPHLKLENAIVVESADE
jgi:hypothetical protein